MGCKIGYDKSHTFDPAKKITNVETIIDKTESFIIRINFYHRKQILVKVGKSDWDVKYDGGRREVFEIGDDEKLFGCKLDECVISGLTFLVGVTWLKMKTMK